MTVVTLSTLADKRRGLQFMPEIPTDTIYRFLAVSPGTTFHSRNVAEPFEIFFISADNQILSRCIMVPEDSVATAPAGTSYVLEAKPGTIV